MIFNHLLIRAQEAQELRVIPADRHHGNR
jgi:hypothetical protein